MLTAISEELKDVVFFYHLPELASALHATVPTMLNFQVCSTSHHTTPHHITSHHITPPHTLPPHITSHPTLPCPTFLYLPQPTLPYSTTLYYPALLLCVYRH